jgi:hypothetical protein
MRIQKVLAAMVFSLGFVALNASAGMINNVDFPQEFIQAKDKAATNTSAQEEVTASADVQK